MTAAVREQLRHEIDQHVRAHVGPIDCECGRGNCPDCHAPLKNGVRPRKRGYRWGSR